MMNYSIMSAGLATPYFYFSYTLDLSHSRQRLEALQTGQDWAQRSLVERAEPRFVTKLGSTCYL